VFLRRRVLRGGHCLGDPADDGRVGICRAILGCITQGVSIGLGAIPDDTIDKNDDSRDSDEIGESR